MLVGRKGRRFTTLQQAQIDCYHNRPDLRRTASVQGEYGKIIGGRIIQDGSQDGKHKNGQLESYPILIIYPFVSLHAVLSKFDVHSVLRVRIHRFTGMRSIK